MKKIILLVITLFLVTYAWISITMWYLGTHEYYGEILSVWRNRWVLILWLIAALLPTFMIFFTSNPTLKKSVIWVIGWVYIFMLWYVNAIGGWPLGLGFLKLLINSLIIFSLLWLFTWTAILLWGFIKRRLIEASADSIFEVCIDFWVWLVTILILVYVLLLLNIFFPPVTRLILGLGWRSLWKQKDTVKNYRKILKEFIQNWRNAFSTISSWSILKKTWVVLLCMVIIFWFWYLINWYALSYMPYSTAWDANHAYFFYPKMRALNYWVYRNEIWMAATPRLRDMFITFWFSVFQPFNGVLTIAPDTIALVMNFFSGVFVLVLGLAVTAKIVEFVGEHEWFSNDHTLVLLWLWWLLLLAWLTSWTWAFLVMVDNKTDLWLLTFLLLALLSWIQFLLMYKKEEKLKKVYTMAWISWFFFAAAVLTKATALFDVLWFWVFARIVRFGVLWGFWIMVMTIWLASLVNLPSIKPYVSDDMWKYVFGWGMLLSLISWLYAFLWKNKNNFKLYMIWVWVFLWTLILVKLPFIITKSVVYERPLSPTEYATSVLLSQEWSTNLASNICSLQTERLTDISQLYKWMEESTWSSFNEDFWRYVGYGWKWWILDSKKNNHYRNLFVSRLLGDGCYWTWVSKILCENRTEFLTLSKQWLQELKTQLPQESKSYAAIEKILSTLWSQVFSWDDLTNELKKYSSEIRILNEEMQANSVLIDTVNGEQRTYIPYKYLNFLNMTYNWSLQNKSSYYTDIWVVWLLLILVNCIALVYWLFARRKILVAVSLTSFSSWILWHLLWSWIVRYNLWMIIWSILAFIVFIYYLLEQESKEYSRELKMTLIGVLIAIIFFQLVLNMMRTISHWFRVWWPFAYYKSNWWIKNDFTNRLEPRSKLDWTFSQKDVFDSQFGYYNTFIDRANNRDSWAWVRIAWTYSRYFIKDQLNIKSDQFVSWLQPLFFDWNACRSYLRLKDKNMRYFALDPNIWTVVQWEWNRSLYDRFFGKVNPSNWNIEMYWAITMFSKLIQEWYMRLISTNNIWTKYALTLPDWSFVEIPEESRELFRARMAVDINWFQIDYPKLIWLFRKWVLDWVSIDQMTQDERSVMNQFVYYRWLQEKNKSEFERAIKSLISRSIYSQSQIIVTELVQ